MAEHRTITDLELREVSFVIDPPHTSWRVLSVMKELLNGAVALEPIPAGAAIVLLVDQDGKCYVRLYRPEGQS